jgi:hypothetical protein
MDKQADTILAKRLYGVAQLIFVIGHASACYLASDQRNQKGNRLIGNTTWMLNKYASVATITTVFHSEGIQLGETSGVSL